MKKKGTKSVVVDRPVAAKKLIVGGLTVLTLAVGLSIAFAKGVFSSPAPDASAKTTDAAKSAVTTTSTPRILADTGLGLEAISRAAADGKYLFAFFWNTENDHTVAMKRVFDDATASGWPVLRTPLRVTAHLRRLSRVRIAARRTWTPEEVMVFSSHLFLFYFLTASLVLYYLSPRWLKHVTLTAVSYVFYGWANPLFVVLMFVSTLIDYLCGLALVGQLRPATWRDPIPLLTPGQTRTTRQRWVLAISMTRTSRCWDSSSTSTSLRSTIRPWWSRSA